MKIHKIPCDSAMRNEESTTQNVEKVESLTFPAAKKNSTKLRLPMMTPSKPVDTQQAFPTTNTDKMIDQVETARVTLSGIILLLTAA